VVLMIEALTGRLTVGVVGAGGIVTGIHLPTLLNLDSVCVLWIADLDDSLALRVGKAFGIEAVALPKDPRALPPTNIVLLAAPYGARAPYFEALRLRDVGVYVEKPFARTVEEHDRLRNGFGESRIADGFQRRSWGPTAAARELVRASPFGPLRRARFGIGGPGIVVGGRYSSDVRLAGGGILVEVGVHGIDLLLHILDAVDVRVIEGTMIQEDGFDLHTDARIAVDRARFEPVECEVTTSSLKSTTNRMDLEFEDATVSFSIFSWEGFQVRTRGGAAYLLTPHGGIYPLTSHQTFHRHWGDFVDGVRSGVPNQTAAVHSRLTTKLVESLYALGAASA
jgi:predicted dehydrogenase